MKQVLTSKSFLVIRSWRCHSFNKQRLFYEYRSFLLLAVIAMLFSSCHKEDNFCKKTVPLKGELVTTGRFVIVPGSPGVPEQVRIIGKGSGTPFGKVTVEDNIKVDLDASPETINGIETITAENGDQIFSTVNGYSPASTTDDFEIFNSDTIIGGSGVYTGAKGSYKQTVKGNIKVPAQTVVDDGSITY